jgi:N-acetylglutamate synthase-like GNAT family acetyltransferase
MVTSARNRAMESAMTTVLSASIRRTVSTTSRVRNARLSDAAALARLLERAGVAGSFALREADVAAHLDRGYLLVLDAGGDTVLAVASIAVGPDLGHLRLLVVDPAFAGLGVEERMTGVALALCEAQGLRGMDIEAPSRVRGRR